MDYIFWICWIGEMAGAIFWIISEFRLKYTEPNPWAYLSAGYLVMALLIRYGLELTAVSSWMVILPGIPLFLYALMIALFVLSGKKWN
jgi:hypothetical protein